jgi:hypothetical protein
MQITWQRWTTVTALGFVVLACTESIEAPAQCPEFCPPERIVIIDSVFTGVVMGDSAFRGYVESFDPPVMQFVTEGSVLETRGVTRFRPFSRFIVGGGDTILSLDSFRIVIQMNRRDTTVAGLTLDLYRLPPDVDTSTRFDDLDPYIADSNRLTTYAVEDTLTAGPLEVVFPGSRLPDVGDDSVAAVAWTLQSPTPTFLDIGTSEGGEWPVIGRYLTILSSAGDTTEVFVGDEPTLFDTFLAADPVPLVDSLLVIGGLPSARSILRFNLPSLIRDSSDIVKATLLMMMSQPVASVPNDGGTIRASAVTRDVGQKSPRGDVAIIVAGSGGVVLRGGEFDTVRLDLTDIMVTWTRDSILPTTIMLSAAPEAGRMFETRVFSSRSTQPPILLLSYIPPFAQRRR